MRGRLLALCATLALVACGPEQGDLKQELEALSKDLRGRVDPLPARRPREEAAFDAAVLPDPFHPWLAVPKDDPAGRRDRMLLSRYSSVEEIDRARARATAEIVGRIAASDESLANLRKRRADLAKESELYKGNKLPSKLASAISELEAGIRRQETFVAARRQELAAVERLYDEDRARYAELRARRK